MVRIDLEDHLAENVVAAVGAAGGGSMRSSDTGRAALVVGGTLPTQAA